MTMKICIDVHYEEGVARVAALGFREWTDAHAAEQHILTMPVPGDYVPGEFYRRELPCLLAILPRFTADCETVVLDGYVWLGERPGLGAHLYEVLGNTVPVIGVAKTPYRADDFSVAIRRGRSERVLYITAAGLEASDAAERVRQMHGDYRIPTLLKSVDRLSRGG